MSDKLSKVWKFKDSSRNYWYVRGEYSDSIVTTNSDDLGLDYKSITNYWDYQIYREGNKVWSDTFTEFDTCQPAIMPPLESFLQDWVSKISSVAIFMPGQAKDVPEVGA